MKKLIAMLLALVMVLGLCACTVTDNSTPTEPADNGNENNEPAATTTEITLWTYPIGNWGNQETVDSLIAAFEAENECIKVTV